jgi:hypothetical protein
MKRLSIVVLFLFLGLFFSCSHDGLEQQIYDPDLENEEDEFIPDLDPDEGEEEQGSADKNGETAEEEDPAEEDKEEEDAALAAEFLSGKFVSETEIAFNFSLPVRVLSLSFEPPLESGQVKEGSTVTVILEENPKPGMRFTASIKAEDEWGNIIDAETSLFSINNRVPKMQINELRTESSNPYLRAEFIEFKMLSDGNLGALRVFAASNTANPMIYQFLPVEVSAGEYVVLHLRTMEPHLAVDEYGDCLEESGGRDSSPTARDIWIPGSVKLLRKTDAVYVMDQDDNVLDAVMISETQATAWTRNNLAEAASFLFHKGAWMSASGEICRPVDAVNSSGIGSAYTRSISRDETADNVGNATNWYIAESGNVTPGLPNKR